MVSVYVFVALIFYISHSFIFCCCKKSIYACTINISKWHEPLFIIKYQCRFITVFTEADCSARERIYHFQWFNGTLTTKINLISYSQLGAYFLTFILSHAKIFFMCNTFFSLIICTLNEKNEQLDWCYNVRAILIEASNDHLVINILFS